MFLLRARNKAVPSGLDCESEVALMKPERELLLEQATACRQLALIADAGAADRLKSLAAEYEALALTNRNVCGRDEQNTLANSHV
jgi:hypothetical protein